MQLPYGNQRFYIRTETFISIIHELETIPEQGALRNDSVPSTITDEDVTRWKRLFGFTTAEAKTEIHHHRQYSARFAYYPRYDSVETWPWPRCAQSGFDRESYNYWLSLVDENIELEPEHAASYTRHNNGRWELFILRPIDQYVNRIEWVLWNERAACEHTVYDWKGRMRRALVVRG